MKQIKFLKYNIAIPDEWEHIGEVKPQYVSTSKNPEKTIEHALNHPISSKPIRDRKLSGKNIAIVVDDITRPTPTAAIFPMVLKDLISAGASLKNIHTIIAIGTHRKLSSREIAERLGVDELSNLNVENHDCFDESNLKHIGKTERGLEVILNRKITEADLIISIGTIEPHSLAGFGGGLKNIIPGCAGIKTITATHLSGDVSTRFANVGKMGESCPTRLKIEEGAMMVKGEYFIINTISTPDGKMVGAFAGHPIAAHREGCKLAQKAYKIDIDTKADILLLSSTPMDIDFTQGTKCFANSIAAAKDNALLIAFLESKEGIGGLTLPKEFLPPRLMQHFARELGTEKLIEIRESFSGKMKMYDKFMQQIMCEMLKRHYIMVHSENLPNDAGRRLGFFEQFSNTESLMKRAMELARGKKTILSLPYAGGSYVVYRKGG